MIGVGSLIDIFFLSIEPTIKLELFKIMKHFVIAYTKLDKMSKCFMMLFFIWFKQTYDWHFETTTCSLLTVRSVLFLYYSAAFSVC